MSQPLFPQDYTQPLNDLGKIGVDQRKQLLTINDFKAINYEYSTTNPDALADGDEMGRGTGVFLDVYNDTAGTSTDIFERKNEIKINKYDKFKTYPNF